MPSEYLDRLLLANRFFGDWIRLEGVAKEDGKLVILTSQPTIVGIGVEDEREIVEFMETRWLKKLNGVSVGYENSLSFYRDLDQLAAFDVHPGNILRDQSDVILPIDLILVNADDLLAAQLEAAL